MGGTRIRRVLAVAFVAVLVPAAVALAATVTLKPKAVYTGKDADCGSSVPGTTCVFKFKSSANGKSLKFIGKSVIDTWGCNGGGGEAILGGKLKGFTLTPIPLVKVGKNGALSGSVNFTFKPTSAPLEHVTSKVTGHLKTGGKKAVVTFHEIYHLSSGNQPCHTAPVTLTTP